MTQIAETSGDIHHQHMMLRNGPWVWWPWCRCGWEGWYWQRRRQAVRQGRAHLAADHPFGKRLSVPAQQRISTGI